MRLAIEVAAVSEAGTLLDFGIKCDEIIGLGIDGNGKASMGAPVA
jgi:hypothetical protein